MGETTKATGGALSGLGGIGFGIYGIGETHGYLNTTIFIIIAITGIYFTSQYLGSRKIRDTEIVYNPNEFFLVTFLCFVSIVGIYSCYSIYNNEKNIGESVANYAIAMVVAICVIAPCYFTYDIVKNRKDKIILRNTEIEITDNGTKLILQHENILHFTLDGRKITFTFKDKTNNSIDLSELNLNTKDTRKLDADLQKYILKKD